MTNNNYSVFIWDSRNTGFSVHIGNYPLRIARDMARATAKAQNTNHYTLQDGNWFEEYENGEKVSWSA